MRYPKVLLVTGGAGFIGCNFVCYWLGKYPDTRVVVLDALTYAGKRENLADLENHPGFNFTHGNICDQALVEELLETHDIDTIVHLAAESHVDRSIDAPDIFVETNIVGTHSLLKAAFDHLVRAYWKAYGLPASGGQCLHLLSHVDDRPEHDDRYAISGEKVRRKLGFAPEKELRRGLSECIGRSLANPG